MRLHDYYIVPVIQIEDSVSVFSQVVQKTTKLYYFLEKKRIYYRQAIKGFCIHWQKLICE